MGAILLSDAELKNMSSMHSTLLQSILNVVKGGGLSAANWDKVSGSWGRSSSTRNDLGEPVTYKDDISVVLDTQAMK